MSAVGLGQFAVVPEVRNMCTVRRLNLTSDTWPFEQKFHLIFLRNVLYYFDPPLRVQILERCYDVTEPGGYLITSLTEPLLDLKTRWKAKGSAIYWKPT
jgi:chemotaxis protein methyltransferase CheR